MRFAETPRRPLRENVVPMINVVFLLLVFFMIASELRPQAPVEVTPPVADLEDGAATDLTLFVGADGTIAWMDLRGDAAIAAVTELDPETRVRLSVDAGFPGREFAALLARLAEAGRTDVSLELRRGN